MKITIVTSAFIPLPPEGGGASEKIWDGLARQFARAGHEVTFFCNRPKGYAPSERLDGVTFCRIPSLAQGASTMANVLRAIPYASRVLLQLDEADILIVNDTATLAMLPPRLESLGKLVIHVQRLPKGPAMRILYGKACRLVAVSEAVLKAVDKCVPDLLCRTTVIGNPADVEIFRTDRADGADGPGRTILYTGRVHPEKGLHLLAGAFRRISADFPSARLRIVGESRIERGGGGPEYSSRLASILEGLDAQVLEPVNDTPGLARVLAAAHVYCYPSLAETGETFGVAVLEACASGLAPIVSDLPAFREFVTGGETGFVFNHRARDPEAELEAVLRRVLLMPGGESKRMGDTACLVASRFSYEKIAEKYLECFEESRKEPGYCVRR